MKTHSNRQPVRRLPDPFLLLACLLFFAGCQHKSQEKPADTKPLEGTFAYDREFLGRFQDIVVLSSADSQAQALLCPAYQGRVMTSTAQGASGRSFGWMNHELIASGKKMQKINAYGGEDRFWLGPEGGQFSIFFDPGDAFVFDDWATPAAIDTEPFELVSRSSSRAIFRKDIEISNYSGQAFSLRIDRTVSLYDASQLESMLGAAVKGTSAVGFASENTMTNTGAVAWTPQHGALSIWILGMFNPSPATTIVIPYRQGDTESRTDIVQDAYFGKVPEDRLSMDDNAVFFSGDGKYRSKIGIGPKNALPWAGSWDAESKVLTLIHFSFDRAEHRYVNSMWEIQEHPFEGDVVNAYNDGPVNGGAPLGPFYELESSSPAAFLGPGESIVHVHSTFHITGDEVRINALAHDKLGVDLDVIKSVF